MEKRLRLSDEDRMLLLLALADFTESHAEYHGLDSKVWTLAERLTGASPGPLPQNVALRIREQTGTLNGPMDTYLPNGQVPNKEPPAGDQSTEKRRGEKNPVEAERRPEKTKSVNVSSAVNSLFTADDASVEKDTVRTPGKIISYTKSGLDTPAPATGESVLRAWQDGRNYQRGRLERERESIKDRYGWRERGKRLDQLKHCQVPGCRSEAYGMTPTWLVVCKVHYPETPPEAFTEMLKVQAKQARKSMPGGF